ncbi:GntR family transcriptional regulator [Chelatococcus composti]|nr:GntR family transcriptional regulator [Chelatococcus composti]GGG49233.1 GntR family transcriptional regulator [Chelatococcus composti]
MQDARENCCVRNEVDPSAAIAPQIYRLLRQAIVTLEYLPGQRLSEQEIGARFGVSRQPVREAFIKLSEAGLVRILPQRGTFVVRISMRDVANARFVREAVEVAVATTACSVAPPEALDRLNELIALQREAAANDDQRLFLRYDEAFHRTLAEAVECASAWPFIEDVKAQMDRVRYLSLPAASPMSRLIDQHAEIVRAIAQRDARRAGDAMRLHLREILNSLPRLAAAHPDLFEDDELPAHAREAANATSGRDVAPA